VFFDLQVEFWLQQPKETPLEGTLNDGPFFECHHDGAGTGLGKSVSPNAL